MSVNKSNNGKDKFSSQALKTDITQEDAASNNGQRDSLPQEVARKISRSQKLPRQEIEVIEVEKKSPEEKPKKPVLLRWKSHSAAMLVGSAIALPILAVGTATYHYGSKAINKQTILAKRANETALVQTELAEQQKLLAALLIGTGTTALLAGALAGWATKRLLDETTKIATEPTPEATKIEIYSELIQNADRSFSQQDVFQAIVEEARTHLNCDRVVVYSLDRNKYGVIVAESVVAGYRSGLGKTISDPCFEARYLDKYRDGRVRAIDDIYQAKLTSCYLEQLERLEVKANLVTPIIYREQLFGLLVAHQCSASRNWQPAEIEFLARLGEKAGFALDNAKLLDDLLRLQAQVAKERKWTNYFTDAIKYIRQSIQHNDVLDISVEEVRRVLQCDRVVVYSLNQDRYGVVVAESVSAGYPRALNKTIEDPCFAARYLDKYRDGRVRAIDNIYEAGMSQCYVEQLETLDVKANLVTPILNEGKLFGLLVAHQCSEFRNWQDYEIRWVTQIATQVGFALDNALLLKKLKHDGLPTQLLNRFSLGISERVNREQLLKIAAEQARKMIKLDRVIVYQLDAEGGGKIVAESVLAGYPRALNSQIDYPYMVREYRQGKTKAIANIERANLSDSHIEQLESLAVKASLVVPVLQEERLFGLLIGHQCQQPRSWLQSEIDLFTQLAFQLGLVLDRVELRAELDLAKKNHKNPAQQELDSENLNRQISQLLVENQAALQALQVQISDYSPTTDDATARRSTISEGETTPNLETTQLENNLTTARKAIAEATDKVEALNQSQQNLHHLVNLIHDLKENTAVRSTSPKPAQLPMGEITVEANEITLDLVNESNSELDLITGQLVEDSQSTANLDLMNQFVGEISNLSERISQQSLFVTESFQKLAEFAKQLSEREE
ncbi:MAG: GAF domain-containing protein [Pleurocapsa sp. MO_226.B13]|nr:GAF domain-containing protein [Pleurocapsa sp. MO_226.B13]